MYIAYLLHGVENFIRFAGDAANLKTENRSSSAYMPNARNEERIRYILFLFSLFGEYIQLEYVRIDVIYRVHPEEDGVHYATGIRGYLFNT